MYAKLPILSKRGKIGNQSTKNAAGRILIVILEYGGGATGVECKKDPRCFISIIEPADFEFRALNLAIFGNHVIAHVTGELHVHEDAVFRRKHVEIIVATCSGRRFAAGRKAERHVVLPCVADVAERRIKRADDSLGAADPLESDLRLAATGHVVDLVRGQIVQYGHGPLGADVEILDDQPFDGAVAAVARNFEDEALVELHAAAVFGFDVLEQFFRHDDPSLSRYC